MKRIITLSILCFAAVAMFAQPALKVADTGNVGINKDAPAEKLDVAGMIALSGPDTGGSSFEDRNHVVYGLGGDKRLQFSSDASTTLSWAWIQMFGDETCASCPNTSKRGNMSIGGQQILFRAGNDNTGFGDVSLTLLADGNAQFTGDVTSTGGTISSDKRLKRDIKAFSRGLDEILQMNPKQYFYNGKGGVKSTQRLHTGVIAQEFKKIVPEAVVDYTFADPRHDISEDYLAVDEGVIKFMLINAVKEQQDLIETQSSAIDDLSAEVEALKDILAQVRKDIGQEINSFEATDSPFIGQNTPNPFNGQTVIELHVPENSGNAEVLVHDISGNLLYTQAITSKGVQNIEFDGANLAAGNYVYTFTVDGKIVESKKMIISK